MSTINISLTDEQVKLVNTLTDTLGFANRSEFFRAVLRRLAASKSATDEVAVWPFVSPPEKSTKKIVAEFKKSKKYSPAFLADLEEGLKTSNYFTK